MKPISFSNAALRLLMLIALILPTATLAKDDDKPYIPPSLVKSESYAMAQFGKIFGKYEQADCESLLSDAQPNGQRLKQCLTITKEMRDKFSSFTQAVGSFSSKIKNADKWTKELDEDFAQTAVKRGIDSKFVNSVKQSGGFRSFYEKNLGTLNQLKGELDEEIKTLEKLQSKSVAEERSSFAPFFVAVSYKRGAAASLSCKSLAVKMVVAYLAFGLWGTGGGTTASGAGAIVCGWLE